MKLTKMRLVSGALLTGAVAASALVPALPPASAEDNLSVTVQGVTAKVDRAGGVTVSGTMNCAAAVAAAGGLPAGDHDVLASVTWTVTQAVGRKGSVTAAWTGGAHADTCYQSWAPSTFLPWRTSYYNSTSTDYYVMPAAGKFVKGPMRVEVRVESFYDGQWNPLPNVYVADPATGNFVAETNLVVDVFAVTQFSVRAR